MENKNMKAVLEELESTVSNNIIDALEEGEQETRPNLWHGKVSAHLISVDVDEYGIHLVFADDNNVPMPSQYADRVGDIWAGRDKVSYQNMLRNFKYALHMSATLSMTEVREELQKRHEIVFYVESSMGKKGMLYRTKVDFAATAAL